MNTHAYCRNCEVIRLFRADAMGGDDVFGVYTDATDLVCTDCDSIITTTYRPKAEDARVVPRTGATPRTDALIEEFRGLSLRGMNIALCDLCRELEGGKIPGVLYSEVSDPTNYNPAPSTGSVESNERDTDALNTLIRDLAASSLMPATPHPESDAVVLISPEERDQVVAALRELFQRRAKESAPVVPRTGDTPRTRALLDLAVTRAIVPVPGDGFGDSYYAADDFMRMAQLAMALERQVVQERFRPMGDNHHNALACPYCNPEHMVLVPESRAPKMDIPSGWKLVPVEPTPAMVSAAQAQCYVTPATFADSYRTMLKAAPESPAPKGRVL